MSTSEKNKKKISNPSDFVKSVNSGLSSYKKRYEDYNKSKVGNKKYKNKKDVPITAVSSEYLSEYKNLRKVKRRSKGIMGGDVSPQSSLIPVNLLNKDYYDVALQNFQDVISDAKNKIDEVKSSIYKKPSWWSKISSWFSFIPIVGQVVAVSQAITDKVQDAINAPSKAKAEDLIEMYEVIVENLEKEIDRARSLGREEFNRRINMDLQSSLQHRKDLGQLPQVGGVNDMDLMHEPINREISFLLPSGNFLSINDIRRITDNGRKAAPYKDPYTNLPLTSLVTREMRIFYNKYVMVNRENPWLDNPLGSGSNGMHIYCERCNDKIMFRDPKRKYQ